MRHIVMSLNNSCVDFIKQEFHFNDNRLDLLRFVWLMRQALDHDPNDHFICYELVKLFEEIDIDGSDTIEWAEFL
jgi:Ca2+-binding EF-hand superfamily protein